MAYKSIFKEPAKPTTRPSGYISIFGDTPKPEIKKEPPKETVKKFPGFLGGGSYNQGENGKLVTSTKGYAGIEAPGQYREHIFPAALGGTSNIDNIKVYGKDLGAKKSAYENVIIKQYKDGKISLPEAKGLVLKKYRELTGQDPKQGVATQIPGAVKETVEDAVSGLFNVGKNLVSNVKSQFYKKPEPAKPVDARTLREKEKQYSDELKTGFKKASEFAVDVARATPRGITSLGTQLEGKEEYKPKNKLQEIVLGKEPVKKTTEVGKDFLKPFAGGKEISAPEALIAGLSLNILDALPFGGKAKNVAEGIIKASTKKEAETIALKLGVKASDDLLAKIIRVTDKKEAEALAETLFKGKSNYKSVFETTPKTPKIAPKQPLADVLLPKKQIIEPKKEVLGDFKFGDTVIKNITKKELPTWVSRAEEKGLPYEIVKEKSPKLASDIANEIGAVKLPDVLVRSAESIAPIKHQDETVKKIFKNWTRELLVGEEVANKQLSKLPRLNDNFDTILKYERGIKTPSSEVIKKEFDVLYEKAKKANPDIKFLENYVPQVYSNTAAEVQTAMSKYMADKGVNKVDIEMYLQGIKELPENISKTLKLNPFFVKERAFPNYETAMAYGLKPRYTEPAQLLAHYSAELDKTTANRKFIDSLLANKKIATVEQAGNDWEALTLPFSPKGYYAPPTLAKMLNGMFRNEEMLGAGATAIKGIANVSKAMQTIQLSAGLPGTTINFFALGVGLVKNLTAGEVKSAVNFIRANFNKATINYFNKNTEYFKMMAEEGIDVTNRAGNYKTIYQNLKNTKGLFKKIGFAWDKSFNEKTFNNLLPMNQLDTFKGVYNKAVQKMSPEEAKKLAGDSVKNLYGLYENLGRGKGTEDALSATFFAPKFREGIINTLFNTGKSVTTELFNPAFRKNRQLMAGMIISYAGYNALNKKLTGHYMWENPDGKEFDLMIPTKAGNNQDDIVYVGFMPSFLSFARNMASGVVALVKSDTSTAKQKFGSLFSMPIKLASEMWANKDYFGRDIYKESDDPTTKLKKLSSYSFLSINHPFIKEIYKQLTTDKPLYQSISESMELPFKFSSYTKVEQQEFYEAINKKAEEVKKIKDNFKPKYTEIRDLLDLGKIDEATEMVDGLNEEDYKLYKSLKAADKTRANVNQEIKIFNEYKEIQNLMSNGQIEEATSLTSKMTDEEYNAYQRLKAKLK